MKQTQQGEFFFDEQDMLEIGCRSEESVFVFSYVEDVPQ